MITYKQEQIVIKKFEYDVKYFVNNILSEVFKYGDEYDFMFHLKSIVV